MTAPVLYKKKFWIVNPKAATNQIKNPTFAHPEFVAGWYVSGTGVTKAITGDEQRFGAYSMQVNPASGVASAAYYNNVTVTNGDDYTFSCYVKGTAGQVMRLRIADSAWTIKATTTFTATGYWQRQEVTLTAAETATTYKVEVYRGAVASTDPFYVDGVQFEQASAATTFIEGYMPGCRWEGYARNSASIRSAQYGLGGEIVDLEDYCHIVQVVGLGHGDWNQIMTKMTSGGDMYQTHIRKSRQFSIIVDFIGNSLGEIESNRAAVIDLLRPDRLRGQEMVVRYQGVDVNGVEATNPVDIVCVPLPATLTDTPDLPTYQRAVLNFSIPSGLFQGAYNEGKVLDLYANFPAELIVKRDPQGNWCKWNGSGYESLITGLNGSVVCMAEGPDGKIYAGGGFTNAGGVAAADYLARWNPLTEKWEAVGGSSFAAGTGQYPRVDCLRFDASGNLYVGGNFTNAGGVTAADYIVKVINPTSATPTWTALSNGTNASVSAVEIAPNGEVYVGGAFTSASGVSNTTRIAKWNGTGWLALGAGLNSSVNDIQISPNSDVYVAGNFTNAGYPYLAKWDGAAFSRVGAIDINDQVSSIVIDESGRLIAAGEFTDIDGNVNLNSLARWNGTRWESIGMPNVDTTGYVTIIGDSPTIWKVFKGFASNKYYAVSRFSYTDGSLYDHYDAWEYSNGSWLNVDIILPPSSWVTNRIYQILSASDGSLYLIGDFTSSASGINAKTGIVALNFEVASASANTYPFMQIHGPGTLKAITNYSTGKSIAFDGLTLNAGEWINLYFDPLNLIFKGGWSGRGNLMRYVVPGSDYGDFYLMPGENLISLFFPDSDPAEGSGAFISWTPLFWGLDGAVLE